MQRPLCLAVDVGGTKIEAGLVDDQGSVIARERAFTPHSLDPEAIWGVLGGLMSSLETKGNGDLVVVGVGCGGPMRSGGEAVSPLNIPAWRGFPLKERITNLTGLPTVIDNDAKVLALGEHWMGAAKDRSNFMAMVVSTGIGGGIVLNGRLLDGRLGNAGHVGHVVVEPQGRACACGGRGCLEAEASGSALADILGAPASQAPIELVERTGTLVGRAVATSANLLDLDLVVVGGSVALGFGGPFFSAARAEAALRARLDFSAEVRIDPVGLGPTGPLLGAAALGWQASSEHEVQRL
ncbi:MAG: ROK family protein [Acidimicrobiales bacterium]